MTTIRFEGRMSDQDALMWAIEKDPLLRSTITSVTLFDAALDRDRLLSQLDRATRMIPRLRQKVVSPPLGVAPPSWVVDPDFDLDYHVRFQRAPGDGTPPRPARLRAAVRDERLRSGPIAVGVRRLRRARGRPRPRWCRRCTTRSSTASAP